ncbi:signal transduction histidine kinase [Azospirillum fermentarium]|uniref:hybrid sensor histidine kinase/response regulator n=1 Tax=Azospirillum fermentarium TaxID=1233114 RepID=UPI002226C719|nr:hybrid sensor histidine kinase/response regulator [Azospirillum fermentarium]MCW2248390.1 signal transduction histidine kinase [Azospirillum fermentarium]
MISTDLDREAGGDIQDASILVVDDNLANVELLREILTHTGYRRVRGETDPRKVPGLLRAEVFDLILLDIRMPFISGFELMEQAKAIYAGDHVPVLVLTAQTDQDTRRRSLEMGANDFLTKPFITWELLHRVRNMLEIRTLYRRAAALNRELEQRVSERTAELSEALADARQANRAKLDFLAVMSHELRTPLNSIIGFAEVMAAQSLGPLGHPEYREYVAMIEESGKTLLTMVNSILDYTRGTTGAIELLESEVRLPQLLDACLAMIHPKAQARQVRVSRQGCPAVSLRADQRRLREIILNLLDNAVKFNRPGGSATLAASLSADRLTVSVTDDGPGVPDALAQRIFSPFTHSDAVRARRHEGIGLGLPIAQRYAELHGGTVELAQAPGGGTVASVHLPIDRLLTRCEPEALN